MKTTKNTPQNQGQGPDKPGSAPVRGKKRAADPGEFRASALESKRSLEDGRDD